MKTKSLIIARVFATIASSNAIASSTEHHHFPGIFIGATTIDSETDF
jgi:hypothetical protein